MRRCSVFRVLTLPVTLEMRNRREYIIRRLLRGLCVSAYPSGSTSTDCRLAASSCLTGFLNLRSHGSAVTRVAIISYLRRVYYHVLSSDAYRNVIITSFF